MGILKGPLKLMKLFTLALLIGTSIIIKFLHAFVTPPFHLFQHHFGNYDEAKGAWDMLASRYSSIDGSREYQLMLDLYHLTQEPNKLLMISLLACNSYGTNLLFLILLGRIVHMLRCMLNEGINITFYQFMMALHDDFEPILGKLLHRIPLPTLDKAIFELVLGETRLQTMHS
jgi:hypothetical protein